MQVKMTNEILKRCDETLATARFGLEDIKSSPERRLAGLRNLVVFGRAITNVLQNLRSTEPDFDKWYEPFQKEMENDPLMKYFYRLRSEILKQGNLGTGSYAHIRAFHFPQDLQKVGPPPPNAKSFFIGDQLGGSGWEVIMDDGSVTKYYVDLPGEIGRAGLHLPEAPDEHLGDKLDNKDIEHLGALYLDYLKRLVEQAKSKFKA
jgi:hypothetical protein